MIKGNRVYYFFICSFGCLMPFACTTMHYEETQLTFSNNGHMLNSTQSFSPKNDWLVYDTRNDDTKIGSTNSIEIVNTSTKETKVVYQTSNQTSFGPGVGAATFSPVANTVLFIHGIRNADESRPYDFTRRTGVAVKLENPQTPIFMDARDITKPYTSGALRGGTHAHTWSGDGEWISFTYNDYILQQLAKKDSNYKDLRVVGVMSSSKNVKVNNDQNSLEANNGEYFSAVISQVNNKPRWGSDEIDRAFDECWIGKEGYERSDGIQQKKALAFQGNVYSDEGKVKTEIFVADLPSDISKARVGFPLEGTSSTMPNVPQGVSQTRITFTKQGVKGPRHWLRSSPDGSMIFFLAEDNDKLIQVFSVSPNGGTISQITFNKNSVSSPFNISSDGKKVAYMSDGSVFVTNLDNHKSKRITTRLDNPKNLIGAPIWSHDDKMIAYNRYVQTSAGNYLQLFLLKNSKENIQ